MKHIAELDLCTLKIHFNLSSIFKASKTKVKTLTATYFVLNGDKAQNRSKASLLKRAHFVRTTRLSGKFKLLLTPSYIEMHRKSEITVLALRRL